MMQERYGCNKNDPLNHKARSRDSNGTAWTIAQPSAPQAAREKDNSNVQRRSPFL